MRLGDNPETLDASSIRAAMLTRAQSVAHSQVSSECTVLRSYLRFLAANGLCRPGLVEAVPCIARRPAASLPRYVDKSVIEALIASCDTATAIGLRGRAVLLLLARLALRSGDITALRLDDINWEQATLTLGGKSRRSATLPLPQDAGDALGEYILRARPRCSRAAVFLNSRAPHCGLSSASVRRAMQRAGIDGDGLPVTHLFRHSRATHLLRDGASPEAVAALLRHQSVETTALYARVDVPMLLEVAQPWPEAVR
ncbi:MAG: tyrosine-type recombinase/integrase [Bryobacterales bacterium]|nr:tyrosine-type recombinase/integrase [Bryobacterales bacterium]